MDYCAYTSPICKVGVYRTIGPLVLFHFGFIYIIFNEDGTISFKDISYLVAPRTNRSDMERAF